MGRKAAREVAVKLLYQMEIQKDNREEQIQTALNENENELTSKDKKYITDIIKGVYENIKNIDELIKKYSKGWEFNRISKVDLSILRLSIFEILFREDIPYNVSVNEAVEIAKKYSSEGAGAFINGILSNLSKQKA
ncbi:MAG TPA: transcription antitermination factor NusB [Clostridiaceae bacterium]|nr:transcription antitermination factor NusB [Clostridiaceae bacterium]